MVSFDDLRSQPKEKTYYATSTKNRDHSELESVVTVCNTCTCTVPDFIKFRHYDGSSTVLLSSVIVLLCTVMCEFHLHFYVIA